MKRRAVDMLVCPRCQSALRLTVKSEDGGEIMQGQLACEPCRRTYEIVRGIPRFVETDSYAESFGRQWNWFRTVQVDTLNGQTDSERMLYATTGWSDSDYRGKVLLDAGVGAGRFADCASRKGAEVFGVDLSAAVDAAFLNVGRRENVHVIQADIFELPFREGTFDLAYSVGVLHHTPDPRAAFDRVAALVKPGGSLAVFMYHRYGYHFSDLWRKITTRIPHRVMAVMSLAAVPVYYIYRIPIIGKILNYLVPISMASNWRERWLDTFDWYTPKYQWKFLYPEIFRWFREDDFRDIQVFDGPIRMRGIKA